MKLANPYRTVQILLTIGCLEFFGPILKDSGVSHLLNPEWVGHARIHLAWLMGFMFFSGLANLYFIWFRQPKTKENLIIPTLWQATNLLGFWLAVVLSSLYKGQLVDHRYHTHILGVEENAFVFGALSILLAVVVYFLQQIKTESYRYETS